MHCSKRLLNISLKIRQKNNFIIVENTNKVKKGEVIMNLKKSSFLGPKANIRLLIFTFTVLMSFSLIMGCEKDKKAAAPPPPPEVKVAKVIQKPLLFIRNS